MRPRSIGTWSKLAPGTARTISAKPASWSVWMSIKKSAGACSASRSLISTARFPSTNPSALITLRPMPSDSTMRAVGGGQHDQRREGERRRRAGRRRQRGKLPPRRRDPVAKQRSGRHLADRRQRPQREDQHRQETAQPGDRQWRRVDPEAQRHRQEPREQRRNQRRRDAAKQQADRDAEQREREDLQEMGGEDE